MAKGSMGMDTDLGAHVRKLETDFTLGTTRSSKYVETSLYEDICKVYAYLESKHTTGETDSEGREKPFFNIVLAARNIWFRSTDIDRSNIKIRATKSEDDIAALLATIHLHDWMRRENFGQFLNNWGLNSAGFNESVLKFIEKDGRLIPQVIPWSRIICDSIDFDNNWKIELLEFTPAQLRAKKGYDKDMVQDLIEAQRARETTDKERIDNKNNYIKLYEVHGMLPLKYLDAEKFADSEEYAQQIHVLSFVKNKNDSEKWDDYTLFKGREQKDPYMLAALMPELDGGIALRGSVKILFEAQWMENHTKKAIKDQLDLASKILFQTSDGTFVGQNALASIQNGDILIHKVNEQLSQVNLSSHDISALESHGGEWKSLGMETVGLPPSMLAGHTGNTSARRLQLELNETQHFYNIMTQNRGLDVEKMMRLHILPFLKRRMDTSKEVSATLSAHNITKVDALYIKNFSIQRTNKKIREHLLNGTNVTPDQQAGMLAAEQQNVQQTLSSQGNQRYFKPSDIPTVTWREMFKNLEWDMEVDVTNENLDPEAAKTLQELLQTVTDPVRAQALQTPYGKMLIDKILRITGAVSPVEMASIPPAPQDNKSSKVSESMAYKDTPEDIKRQIEKQAGLVPSTLNVQPVQPQVPGQPNDGSNMKPLAAAR